MHLKLPKIPRVRSWSGKRKRAAWWAKHLHKRQQPEPEPQFDLLNGLVAYWKLDEDTGEVRLDSSGNDLHLTDNNFVTLEAGFMNGAAGFAYDGGDRWLDHADDLLLQFESEFTMSFWVYRTGSVFGADTILNKTAGLYLFTHTSVGHHVALDLVDADGVPLYDSMTFCGDTVIQVNHWHHVVLYRTGNTWGIVTDGGTPVEQYVEGEPNQSGVFRIGAHEGGYPFTGNIDEVGKWNRALSPEEIAALYNEGNGLAFEEF